MYIIHNELLGYQRSRRVVLGFIIGGGSGGSLILHKGLPSTLLLLFFMFLVDIRMVSIYRQKDRIKTYYQQFVNGRVVFRIPP